MNSEKENAKYPGRNRKLLIAVGTLAAIGVYCFLHYALGLRRESTLFPLYAAYIFGGLPVVFELIRDVLSRKIGSDTLAGISIITAFILGEYLAGCVVILMLSGGESLESFALTRASSVLRELSRRIPSVAHAKGKNGQIEKIHTDEIKPGDELVILPHEICPVDGVVIEGHGHMDESYLTGEPYEISKAPGSHVISGAVNGTSAISIRALRPFQDSRYARIMKVVEETEQKRPRLRRLGDQLGAWYTPFSILIACAAWLANGNASYFLAVLVVATPCPLIIGIPIAVLGAISLAARRAIIIRNPAALELLAKCRVIILDKTGTLTTGKPVLTEQVCAPNFNRSEVLQLTASIERYSKHPLAGAIVDAALKEGLTPLEVHSIEEPPGKGLRGTVGNIEILTTSRKKFLLENPGSESEIPESAPGLECIVLLNGRYASTFRFRDLPRPEGKLFISHLGSHHNVHRVLLVSGDRESEVRYLADEVGITEIYASQQPEDKVRIVEKEMKQSDVIFIGDGINDAPALNCATVGIAFGNSSDVIVGAADAVVMDSTLRKADELLHIGMRMRRIAMQSAIGGIALSFLGMIAAAFGYLTPLAGALVQEIIDVGAVLNALRAAYLPKHLSDYKSTDYKKTAQ